MTQQNGTTEEVLPLLIMEYFPGHGNATVRIENAATIIKECVHRSFALWFKFCTHYDGVRQCWWDRYNPERFFLQGSLDPSKTQQCLYDFIQSVALCPTCRQYSTTKLGIRNGHSDTIILYCRNCNQKHDDFIQGYLKEFLLCHV